MQTSEKLFYPLSSEMKSFRQDLHQLLPVAESLRGDLKDLLSQKSYPCIAAVQSFFKNEYRIGVYADFGSGNETSLLAQDLASFQEELQKNHSPYLSFFATFPQTPGMSEEEFEMALWREISFLSADPRFRRDWDSRFSANPDDTNFCFSFNGEAFFVVGLSPSSSRKSRRFKTVTLIFNSFNQFEWLKQKGIYDDMVQMNRQRDEQFDGTVNPMAAKYGEQWESIQFSGKNNPPEWKCPFAHLLGFFKS